MGFKRETRIYAQPEGTYIMHVLKTWGWSRAPFSLAVPLFYWRIIKQPELCNCIQQQPFPCSWSNCVRDIWTIKINLFLLHAILFGATSAAKLSWIFIYGDRKDGDLKRPLSSGFLYGGSGLQEWKQKLPDLFKTSLKNDTASLMKTSHPTNPNSRGEDMYSTKWEVL